MLVDVPSQLLRPAVQTRRRAPTASMLLDLDRVGKSSQHAMASALAALVLTSSVSSPSLAATDGAAIGKCLLTNCQLPLAKCVTNPTAQYRNSKHRSCKLVPNTRKDLT